MDIQDAQAQQWLEHEDAVCRQDRIARLTWLASITPDSETWMFPGGWMALRLFDETRYSFVYAQYLAAVVLGLAFIERILAARFYATGRNDLERANVSVLIREAVGYGWISQEEEGWLNHAREIRNPITHFRHPGHNDTVEFRSMAEAESPDSIVEGDARHVMIIVMRLHHKNTI